MKKLLLLFTLLPLSLFGQRVELNVMGGAAFSSTPNNIWDKKSSSSAIGSVQASVEIKTLSLGIKVDMFSHKSGTYYETVYIPNNQQQNLTINSSAFGPCIPLSLFVNKKFSLPRGFVYLGVSGGIVFGSGKTSFENKSDFLLPPNSSEIESQTGSSFGLSFGAQLGYRLPITKHIGLIAELSPRYISVSKAYGSTDHPNYFNALIVPVTAGLSFRL